MVRDALARGDTSPLVLLSGVRHEEDRLYRDELEALAAAHPNFRVLYTLSRPQDDWRGLRGYVQTHVEGIFRELAASGAEPPHVYICGLERMVGAVRDLLRKQMGVDRKQVHSERYD
jgi:NAD(P)H-flavin reductase